MCYLTRDFVTLLKCFLTRADSCSTTNHLNSNGAEFDENSMDETPMNQENGVNETQSNSKSNGQTRSQAIITDFALKILQSSPTTCEYSLMILFDGLSWLDTSSVTKLLLLCQSFLKQVQSIISGKHDILRQLYIYILCALRPHGENEQLVCSLLTLAISIYEMFVQTCSNLFESVLAEIPGVTMEQVNCYRNKMQRHLSSKGLNEKEKRDALKSLVQPLMGSNVAQMFRREPLALNDLPPLVRFSKSSLHPALQHSKENSDENEDHALANLFQSNDD